MHVCACTHRPVCNTLLFHRNSGFVNAPQCYVTRTLPIFLFCTSKFIPPACRWNLAEVARRTEKVDQFCFVWSVIFKLWPQNASLPANHDHGPQLPRVCTTTLVNTVFTHPSHYRYRRLWQIPWPRGLRVKTRTQRSGAGRRGAGRRGAASSVWFNSWKQSCRFVFTNWITSCWPLRCVRVFTLRLAVTRLLGLRVWIPPGAWMFVSRECCLLL
jgi:hypothetical protein